MSTQPFRFKQFTIHQDRCAMKIGTDGVLVGAWTDVPQQGNVLDIGTGTGLLALMMAQRSQTVIDAIEINDEAAQQSAENFAASPWANRLQSFHVSIQDFVADKRYDLILSNPPYFESAKGIESAGRLMARNNATLSLEELVATASTLLTQEGSLALILPSEEEERLLAIAEAEGFFPNRLCRVKGTAESKVKRILVQMSAVETTCVITDFTIETSRHIYSEDYKALCKDFYLAM